MPIMAMGLNGKGKEGVFVRGDGRYTVGDDLTVRPASLGRSFELASRLGIDDGSELEEKVVKVGEEEVRFFFFFNEMMLIYICFVS